jgi:hypothetical protein
VSFVNLSHLCKKSHIGFTFFGESCKMKGIGKGIVRIMSYFVEEKR